MNSTQSVISLFMKETLLDKGVGLSFHTKFSLGLVLSGVGVVPHCPKYQYAQNLGKVRKRSAKQSFLSQVPSPSACSIQHGRPLLGEREPSHFIVTWNRGIWGRVPSHMECKNLESPCAKLLCCAELCLVCAHYKQFMYKITLKKYCAIKKNLVLSLPACYARKLNTIPCNVASLCQNIILGKNLTFALFLCKKWLVCCKNGYTRYKKFPMAG